MQQTILRWWVGLQRRAWECGPGCEVRAEECGLALGLPTAWAGSVYTKSCCCWLLLLSLCIARIAATLALLLSTTLQGRRICEVIF